MLKKLPKLLALSMALSSFVTGMSGCGGSESFDESLGAKLELVPNDAINVSIGQVAIGGAIDLPVKIRNLGNIAMALQEVRLAYVPNGAVDDKGPAFILASVPGLPTSIEPFTGTAGVGEIEVVVRFTRQTTFASRVATLVVITDAKFDGTASVPILEQPPAAVGSLSPEVIDFATVELDTVAEKFAKMNSTGSEALVCDGFALRGHPDFTLHVGEQAYPVSEATLQRATIDPPLVVAPNTTTDLRLTFAPTTESSAEGELIFFCNDLQSATGGHSIVLLANQNVPCIEVTPLDMEFGGKIVGQIAQLPVSICSCGGSGLQLTSIVLDPERSEPDFQLSFAGTGGGVGPNGIDPAAPLLLDFGDCIDVAIQYVPDVVSPLDADNRPIPDRAVLQVLNDSFEPTVEVTISGIGLEGTCPVPIIVVDEGEQVVPQTILHLDSNQSYSPNGAIIDQEWSVVSGPDGSVSTFIPSAKFETPVFEVNLAGVYTFGLCVRDEAGKWSDDDGCECASYTVVVIPDEAIHVELVWSTAGDLNAEDTGEGNGADLDLHYAHPFATGPQSLNPDIDGDGVGDPWFDKTFDSFWFNPNPNWGAFDPNADDDPSLDRDDIDGWGPENLNLNVPEDGATYHIGVHYWNDWGLGETLATVRVYIYGELDAEVKDIPLQERDFWYVGTIPWAAGTGTTLLIEKDGGQFITTGYLNPAFVPPIDAL